MSDSTPDSPRQLADEGRKLVERLNTHLDLCEAQGITHHLQLVDGRFRYGKDGITRKREVEHLWQPEQPEEAENDD